MDLVEVFEVVIAVELADLITFGIIVPVLEDLFERYRKS